MPAPHQATDPTHCRTRERGSASVELVVLTPVLVLFLLLYLGFGRITRSEQLVNDAAAQAARAATLNYQTPTQAQAAAQQAATQALTAAGLACTTDHITVETSNDHPGGTITITLACHADLSQAVATGLPGSVTLTATATSPIDPYVPESLEFRTSEGFASRSLSREGWV
jgi:Flp pilus assembly protein TadG